MDKATITGYYYRRKYDKNVISFTYGDADFLTDGKSISPLSERCRKYLVPIEKFDTSEIRRHLELYKEYNFLKRKLLEALNN